MSDNDDITARVREHLERETAAHTYTYEPPPDREQHFSEEDRDPKAEQARRFAFHRIGDLEPRAPVWLIKGILEADSLVLLFGDPSAGKSFLALDWLACIATGKDWHGHRVAKAAPTLYICGEGRHGVLRRLAAWTIRHQINRADCPLFVSSGPAALSDPEFLAEVDAAIAAVVAEHGSPAVVAIDTVARNFGAGDENSTKDMTAFIAACDHLRTKYEVTILLVHHAGHGDKTRARGSIALKGALDAEYRLDRDPSGVTRVEATKMKDAELPEPMAFRLRTVELGIIDEDGQPVTSAVFDATSYEPPPAAGKEGRGKWQTLAKSTLDDLRQQRRDTLAAGGMDPSTARVSIDDWRVECLRRGMPRQRFAEVKDKLLELEAVMVSHGFVF